MTVEIQGMSAIVLHNVSSANIQLDIVCSREQDFSDFNLTGVVQDLFIQVGIFVYESNFICIEFSVVDTCSIGIFVHLGRHHIIKNTIATNSKFYGIILYATYNTRFMNCNVMNTTNIVGILIVLSTYTSLMNVCAEHNQFGGIWIEYSTSTSLINVSVEHNQVTDGILIESSTSTSLMNVSAEYNGCNGISIASSTSTSLINVHAERNQWNGINTISSTFTSFMNVFVEYNHNGIYIADSMSTSLMNVSAEHNRNNGIYIFSKSTSLKTISAQNNQQIGISIFQSQNVSLYDISLSKNSNGLQLQDSHDIIVIRANVSHDNNHGISLIQTNGISITNGTLSSIVVYSTASLQVSYCLFSEVDASTTITNTDPDSLPAIIELYDSSLNISECNFTRNNISSVKAFNSSITVSGDMLFSDNTAISGTVFNLRKKCSHATKRCAHLF